jgi:hypothetical protein
MESILKENESSLVEFFQQALTSRVDKENIGLVANYYIYKQKIMFEPAIFILLGLKL